MIDIFNEKQQLLTTYVSDEMSQSVDEIDSIRGDELFNTSLESGKKFKRIVSKIQIFQMFNNSNINDSIEIHLIPKLVSKLKEFLSNENSKLIDLIKKNSYLELMKEIEYYYEFREEMKVDLQFHVEHCEEEYKNIDETILQVYKHFSEDYNELKSNRPASNEQ